MSFTGSKGWLRWVRPQDLVWVLLFGVLIATSSVGDVFELSPLVALGVLQIVEPKIPALATTRGRVVAILLKLTLAYLLIGYSGGVSSRYWVVLLLPVVSVATVTGVGWTVVWMALAAGAYFSFLLFPTVDWFEWIDLLVERVVFLAMVGTLANMLAEDLRIQSAKHQRTAKELALANAQLREAEEAVRRSDRLAALGQLSAGLAHELRNPLGTIRASSEMLAQSVRAENEVAREVAGFIRTEVDRCNGLITRFLQFARPLELQREKVDLAKVLDQAIGLVEREAPGIAIYRNYQPELRPFPFDAELMERVFYNLILNAAQASTEGGAVTVKTRSAGGTAEVAVIDRGSGIEAANLSSIFNPFFTTKPSGVGLGLAIVAKIVDEHGGKITVESEPGKGSIFRLALPLEPAAPQAS
ncbi:MAG TPA: ATP-binding protein [Candidatus Sulfopaludibacter sp.]|jgi:signal transduction histidine kinase|nr:ATP-binding protein [Candidatus Sulfopaludibacter sp.]